MKEENPFNNLLKEENLNRINIDKYLIPFFKIVVLKLGEYFEKNDLLKAKDWSKFFEKYLLEDGENKHTICFGKEEFEYLTSAEGYYNERTKKIVIREGTLKLASEFPDYQDKINYMCCTLAHEFIHFLVMADMRENNNHIKISDSNILNEGLTQMLTMKALGVGNYGGSYLFEMRMANYYLSWQNENEGLECFLKNKFPDEVVNQRLICIHSERFAMNNTKSEALNIQEKITEDFLNTINIDSFEMFQSVLEKINHSPILDYFSFDSVNNFYKKIVNLYLNSIDMQDNEILTNELLSLCEASNKVSMYLGKETAEYVIDDLHIAFDRTGESYGEFPKNGIKMNAQVGHYNGTIHIIHNDKEYYLDIKNANFTNWKEKYDAKLDEVKNLLSQVKGNDKHKF